MAADTQPASLSVLKDKVRFLDEATKKFQDAISENDLDWEKCSDLIWDIEDYAKLVIKAGWAVDKEIFEAQLNEGT